MEIDEGLLERARRALGQRTIRATIEEALRRSAAAVEAELSDRAARQRRYVETLAARVDVDVLMSDQMWR